MENIKLSFLTENQILGDELQIEQLEIFKKYGTNASLSDFSIILGASVSDEHTSEGTDLKHRTGWYWTKTSDSFGDVIVIDSYGYKNFKCCQSRNTAARTALTFLNNSLITANNILKNSGFDEIEYGEYPQTIVDKQIIPYLEADFNLKTLTPTGKDYTIDSRKPDEYVEEFYPTRLTEYEFEGQKYVRVKVNSYAKGKCVTLSDGQSYKNDEYVWVRVEPIKWIKEPGKNLFVSKKCLYAGVRFDNKNTKYHDSKFAQTEINKFMQTFFIKDIIPSKTTKSIKKEQPFTISNFTFVDKDGNKKKKRIVVKVKSKN